MPGQLEGLLQEGVPTQILIDGIPRDGWGLTWLKLPPSTYTESFTDAPGLGTPVPESVTSVPGQTATLEGRFQRHGWLRVLTDPPVPGTVYVDGRPRDDWGMWQSMPPGSYVVSFGAVTGYLAPAAQMANVIAGELTTLKGTYQVAVPTGSPASADSSAESSPDLRIPWDLSLPAIMRSAWDARIAYGLLPIIAAVVVRTLLRLRPRDYP
ncbi:MAG: hypothetical protein ACT4OI_09655 [Methanobacteriota archaeon]